MKNTSIFFFAVCLIVSGCTPSNKKTQETTADSTAQATSTSTPELAPPPDTARMNRAWMEYATPGEMHKWMTSGDGTWVGDMTMWMHPDMPPMKGENVQAVYKMSYGGRYQESKHTGNFMGMPFEGTGVMAYDNAAKKFVNTWYDNMGTGIMIMEGTFDAATKTLSLKGKAMDAYTGKEVEMRETLQIIDENNRKMEMYSTQWGPETKSMEIMMRRK